MDLGEGVGGDDESDSDAEMAEETVEDREVDADDEEDAIKEPKGPDSSTLVCTCMRACCG